MLLSQPSLFDCVPLQMHFRIIQCSTGSRLPAAARIAARAAIGGGGQPRASAGLPHQSGSCTQAYGDAS
eukprot:5436428-Alexandrium_andersonii.AAC.1